MAQGNGKLKKGYASGVIMSGKSVTLTLAKPGIYLIGCFFHYGEGMRDVLVVSAKATPGPEATPPAR
jgi:plastocyanin